MSEDMREEFLNGVLAFCDAMNSINLDPDKMVVTLAERDGLALEHMLTRMNRLVASASFDDRYSKPKADMHIREFQIAGIKFQYRIKPLLLPSGDIV